VDGMSERFTIAKLKGIIGSGLAELGRLSPEDMIKKYKEYASYQVELYSKVLNTPDEDIHVETYVGTLAQKKREIIQEGKNFKEDA
jgi:hypothetical protein